MNRALPILVFCLFSSAALAFVPSKFKYGCAERPFTHPDYSRADAVGVCTTKVRTERGIVTVEHEAKNTQWALWLVTNEVCIGMDREILGLPYACAWKPKNGN